MLYTIYTVMTTGSTWPKNIEPDSVPCISNFNLYFLYETL